LSNQNNYLRSKRQWELAYGQAGSMLKFFRDKIAENLSFQYYLELQECNAIMSFTQFLWALPCDEDDLF
jgi:zinc finger SWIM domain-containing protein 3